ncbi:glycosyltransferase [Nonomuraea sp. NPDC050404]|uniref:glycosyltransferase family 2 protein n=1 Tax=Nonomuraea sp. NPDC050404 TaxID=3155783 RepID=UPI0033E8DA65
MITVVIPTIGRPSLRATLAAVGPDVPVIVVDDRKASGPPGTESARAGTVSAGGTHEQEPSAVMESLPAHVRVVRSGGRGPAAARNAGWRAAGTPWVVFLDDDVVPAPGWAEALHKDLIDLPGDVAGSQGRIVVPLPERPPTDAERHTAGLAGALWVTADMAYRPSVLAAVGGFDERFPRAYREDADLALRVGRAGHRLVVGERVTAHPVRADGFWASVRFQRGNADDALMRRLHGPSWRTDIGGGPGRLRLHALTTATGLTASLLAAASLATRRRVVPVVAWVAAVGWAGLSAEFAWRRIAPGPRTPGEVLRMSVTSVLIPPVACVHRLRGEWRVRR